MIGPLCYIGGKRRLAPLLITLFPPHVTYVEPFAGGAQVFFHKPPSRVEILNDIDGEVVNFLRICQLHHEELVRCVRFTIPSRRLHQLYGAQDPTTLTDVQRAVRFLYLQKNSFGGRIHRQNYHYCVAKPSNFNPRRVPDVIRATAKRLEGVQLECWPYEKVLERYDRPTTLFYCDPPYVGVDLYRTNFADEDFAQLARRLANIRGKFVLSINDCALSRSLFRAFHCREVSLAYTSTRRVPTVTELVFSNYPLPSHAQSPVSAAGRVAA
jgi:DNA adenine methylase